MTFGEKYDPSMTVTDQAEADSLFEKLVEHSMSFGNSKEKAEEIERRNLGYWAGYFDNETRERVERLFKCEHPIFGAIAKIGPPTPLEAFELGKQWAAKERKPS